MIMSKTALTLLLSLFTLAAMAAPPITLYSSLKDYQSGKGKVIGEYEGYEWSKQGVVLLTPPEKGRKPVVHDVAQYWGFSIGKYTYRLYEGMPHVILKEGKGVYYENGLAHMDMSLDVKDRSDVDYGKYCFLSESITSPIVYVPGKDARKAFEGKAALAPFLECIDRFKWTQAEKIRECLPQLD